MSLTVEDGTGVAGAESYATVAFITAYWAARSHAALYSDWDGADTPTREGAAREATSFLDSIYGQRFKGTRKGYVQGLEWPRSEAKDSAGYPLPDLPAQLKAATAELAARAVTAVLVADVKPGGGAVKRIKAGPAEIEYVENGSTTKKYPIVESLLAPLMASNAFYFGVASRT